MLTPVVTEASHEALQRWIMAVGCLTFQVDATDQPTAEIAAREQFRGLLHREPVVAPMVIDYAPLP